MYIEVSRMRARCDPYRRDDYKIGGVDLINLIEIIFGRSAKYNWWLIYNYGKTHLRVTNIFSLMYCPFNGFQWAIWHSSTIGNTCIFMNRNWLAWNLMHRSVMCKRKIKSMQVQCRNQLHTCISIITSCFHHIMLLPFAGWTRYIPR